ncbi:MAG: 4Fe-4S dicluster domain-containing protein [bacterium]
MGNFFKLKIEDGDVGGTINLFLRSLLEKGVVRSVLAPKTSSDGASVLQALVHSPSETESIDILAPVMPVNAASLLSDLTRLARPVAEEEGGGTEPVPIAAVLRPCEWRAVVELTKLKQINLNGTLMITGDCYGAIPAKTFTAKTREGVDSNEIYEAVRSEANDVEMRSACLVCEYPTVNNSDLTICFMGSPLPDGLLLEANTEKGERILGELGLEPVESLSDREKVVKETTDRRTAAKEKLAEHVAKDVAGLENLLNLLATCVNCHNCMRACPICYCKECFFDSAAFEAGPDKYLNRAQKKGALRMPSDTLLFHLGRLNHMSSSCVACGSCEEACPNGVELLKVFKTVGNEVQKVFEYVPGRSFDEELPLATFREDELEPR